MITSNPSTPVDAKSAYYVPARPASEHYSALSVQLVRVQVPIALAPVDPLTFSRERMLLGEADVAAGRVEPFAQVMDALRARVRDNSP
jgi:hypothetical protein